MKCDCWTDEFAVHYLYTILNLTTTPHHPAHTLPLPFLFLFTSLLRSISPSPSSPALYSTKHSLSTSPLFLSHALLSPCSLIHSSSTSPRPPTRHTPQPTTITHIHNVIQTCKPPPPSLHSLHSLLFSSALLFASWMKKTKRRCVSIEEKANIES